jgi:hypothetical protein
MSKKKNKGKKPEQKDIKKNGDIKETEVKETEELDEETEAEEITEDAEEVEEAETKVSEPEEAGDQTEESDPDDEEAEKKTENKSDKKPEDKSEKKSDNSGKKSEKKDSGAGNGKSKQPKEKPSERDEFLQLSFTEKCKKDPVIPVMLLLAFVAVIVAIIYFVMPNAKTPSLGFTLDDFKTRYNNGEVATQLYANGMDIGINYTTYIDRSVTPSILGEKETFTVDSSNVDYFNGDAALMLSAGVEGATRKNDGELAYVRVYVEYDESDIMAVWMFYANTLQAVFPDLTRFDALDLSKHEMSDYKADGSFTVRGDTAFRLIPLKTMEDGAEKTYIVIEVVPKSAISQSQISHEVEVTTTESTAASSAASESVAETVASAAET